MRSNLSALNTQVQGLVQPGTLSPFGAKTVISSNGNVATATASSAATSGTHTLLVTQLARQSTVVSTQWSHAGTELVGAVGAGSHTFRISVNGVDTDVTVAIGAADDNKTVLSAMAAAINGSEAKVTASVVNDSPSTARLVLASAESGSANAIALADQSGTLVAATGANSGVQSSGTTGGFLYASDQLDARFVFDGLTITRGANTVDDVLTGVTFRLTATQAADAVPVALTVGPDDKAIQGKVQAFLDAYNTTIKFLKERTGVSVSTDTTAVGSDGRQVGDPWHARVRVDLSVGLMMNLRADVGGRIAPGRRAWAGGAVRDRHHRGQGRDAQHQRYAKFTKGLTENPDGVTTLFNFPDGIANRRQRTTQRVRHDRRDRWTTRWRRRHRGSSMSIEPSSSKRRI